MTSTTTWVYRRSEPTLWTVGFYDPEGTWQPESDHGDPRAAADRVHWLNGGSASHPERPPGIRIIGRDPDHYTVELLRLCPQDGRQDCPHTTVAAARHDVLSASFLEGFYTDPAQINSEGMRAVVRRMITGGSAPTGYADDDPDA
jgi:hypothetical protein